MCVYVYLHVCVYVFYMCMYVTCVCMYMYDIYDIKVEMRLFGKGKLRWRKERIGGVPVVKVHDSLE